MDLFPPHPLPLKHFIQLWCKKYPSCTWSTLLSPEMGNGRAKKAVQTDLVQLILIFQIFLHHLLPLAQTTLSCPFFKNSVFLCLKGSNASCSGHFFESLFSFEEFHVYVNTQQNVDTFLLLICLVSLIFRTQPGTL